MIIKCYCNKWEWHSSVNVANDNEVLSSSSIRDFILLDVGGNRKKVQCIVAQEDVYVRVYVCLCAEIEVTGLHYNIPLVKWRMRLRVGVYLCV